MAKAFAPTPLQQIRSKVSAYHSKFDRIADELKKIPDLDPKFQLDKQKEYMQFYIEKADLRRLNEIADTPSCEAIVVFFGLGDQTDSVTGCFLGIDKNKQIIPEHRESKVGTDNTKPGEDTWLPPGKLSKPTNLTGRDFTLADELADIIDHLKD